jgi:hypothetical protein
VSLAAHVVAPSYWPQFIAATLSNLDEPQSLSVPPPLPLRLPLAAALVVWGARTDRPWTVAVAATLALPIVWPHGLALALAAVPFARRGDQAATQPDWMSAARLRNFVVIAGTVLGVALLVALVFAGPLSAVIDRASERIAPHLRLP